MQNKTGKYTNQLEKWIIILQNNNFNQQNEKDNTELQQHIWWWQPISIITGQASELIAKRKVKEVNKSFEIFSENKKVWKNKDIKTKNMEKINKSNIKCENPDDGKNAKGFKILFYKIIAK